MKLSDTGVVVLASGLSKRFGRQNKLLAMLNGRPIAEYIADTIHKTEIRSRIVVVPNGEVMLSDIFRKRNFQIVENQTAELGQGASLSLGVSALSQNAGVKAVFVCLADMPFIQPEIFADLASAIDDRRAAICTDGRQHTPPALFTREAFPGLISLTGDQGAKRVLDSLSGIAEVVVSAVCLKDIDHPEDLLTDD
ncbi:nucleotidyltransferase family protein [Hyphococcus lacteus]|uniref:Nucleotidyltransferase family protein n=1 Tax=Hyphococcus lacteus TaxID=3143536 RepID=A0ABV3Z6R7_9PROT